MRANPSCIITCLLIFCQLNAMVPFLGINQVIDMIRSLKCKKTGLLSVSVSTRQEPFYYSVQTIADYCNPDRP